MASSTANRVDDEQMDSLVEPSDAVRKSKSEYQSSKMGINNLDQSDEQSFKSEAMSSSSPKSDKEQMQLIPD